MHGERYRRDAVMPELRRETMLGQPAAVIPATEQNQRLSWWAAVRAVRIDRLLVWNALFAGWLCLFWLLFGKWLVVAGVMAVWAAMPWN
jgi:hypothetical protein